MAYRVEVTAAAVREFRKLPRDVQIRLGPHIDRLAAHPRPTHAVKLSGVDGYRIRIGPYRILYEVDDVDHVVRVVKVGHRREVYRGV
jgi:mRNA interferase RelE/StbE